MFVFVNIKEWFDFLCVLFILDGVLVVNVLYIFVYLGLMGMSVKVVLNMFFCEMYLGDVFVLNDLF